MALELTNFEALCENIYKREIPVKGDQIAQTYRNQLRQELMEALCRDLNGTRTVDGIILEIPNEIEGAIFAEINIKLKRFDYDIDEAVAVFNEKVERREELAAKQRRKEERRKMLEQKALEKARG